MKHWLDKTYNHTLNKNTDKIISNLIHLC